jgi:hypothetical protein
MKNREDVDIDQVLKNYLSTVSQEQLIAELEAPRRVELMAIPDQNFFFTQDEIPASYAPLEACDIFEAFNPLENLVSDLVEKFIWETSQSAPRQIIAASLMANAANQELALAA